LHRIGGASELQNELSVVYDKFMFENRERKHELEQHLEALSTRISALELEQRRKHSDTALSAGGLLSSAKLIKFAISLISLVMLAISMCVNIAHSAFRSHARAALTVCILFAIAVWWFRDAFQAERTYNVGLLHRLLAWLSDSFSRTRNSSSISDTFHSET
jgi:hypothetical protein